MERESYNPRMPFKDTPGLRRIAMQAIEERPVVWVRVLPHGPLFLYEGTVLREGEMLQLSQRRADDLVSQRIAALVE
jgi:hypothetical protein